MNVSSKTLLSAFGVVSLLAPSLAHADILDADMMSLRAQLRGQMLAELTDYGTGDDRLGDRTDLRFARFRLTLTGMYDENYGFQLNTQATYGTTKSGITGYSVSSDDTDNSQANIRLHDAYFIANYSDALNFKIGMSKIPTTRGNLDGCFDPLGIDRSMWMFTGYGTTPIKASRDMGVTAWGKLFGGRSVYQAGVFQGREGYARTTNPFTGAAVTSSMTPSDVFMYTGRIHYSFWDQEASSGYEGSYLGDLKVLTFGLAVAYESDAVYRNVTSAGVVLDSDTVDMTVFTADVLFELPTDSGTYTLTSAYLEKDFEDVYRTNLNPGDRLTNYGGVNGQKKGWYVRGAYLLPQTFGKEGRLQPYAYYEKWDVAFLAGVSEQTVTQKAVGVNWYIKGQNVRFTLEALRNDFAKPSAMVGGRLNANNQPIDFYTENTNVRAMFQVAF
ncbi:hypothetical protein ASA1KI_28010 [Opitutales bacterium ASA1]|uniref:selenite/tellurite reduction operon porin ExtI n=1 Tax=Congregicoccus parvus TaxID=3081749 RepID=UPI002B2992E5|nr:hypothetical protein ASA1KI_28010 [Opitutales bacterium ASA1]